MRKRGGGKKYIIEISEIEEVIVIEDKKRGGKGKETNERKGEG